MNSPESEIPGPNLLENLSSELLVSDAIRKCDESNESLSYSKDSSSEYDFEQSECEIDSNSNYFDELSKGPMPRSFFHLDVSAPSSTYHCLAKRYK